MAKRLHPRKHGPSNRLLKV